MSGSSGALPEPLGESVRRELDRVGGGQAGGGSGISDLVSSWERAVGETVARHAWPSRLTRDGTLVVHTSSSTWAFELSQLQATILEQLGDLAPPRLKFVAGPLPEPGADSEQEASRLPRQPDSRERARASAIAAPIGDRELRELVARAAAASLSSAASDPGSTGASGILRGR